MSVITTLLIPYRRREKELNLFIERYKFYQNDNIEAVIIEADEKPTAKKILGNSNIKYHFLNQASNSVFHKTKYLNLGLSLSSGDFVCPFDIDYIPYKTTLFDHIKHAIKFPDHILTGYRVNVSPEFWENVDMFNFELCAEDSKSGLRKYLFTKEKYGICPIFRKSILLELNGWDENFKGWGFENHDLIARYLNETNGIFLRSPNLLYLHLKHPYESYWNNDEIAKRNRYYYESKLKKLF